MLLDVKTLAVRMRQHTENKLAVAAYSSQHFKVKKVNDPGLAMHPQHELAKRQMTGFGGMLSFETRCLKTPSSC